MAPEQLKEAIKAKFGPRGGSKFCRFVGVSRPTLHRWEAGECPVPAWVGVVLGLMKSKMED